MLQKMLEYVVGLSKPELMEVNGYTYSDKKLNIIPRETAIKEPLPLSTLTGLLSYISSGGSDFIERFMIHIVSPECVRLVSPLDEFGSRDILTTVNAELPAFAFGRYYDAESFLINVRAKFQETEDRDLIIKFAGSAEIKTLQSYKDDGISQKVTVSKGIAGKEDALVPTIVKLKPYSTFLEVEQPERQFIFRMKDEGRELSCALFEADGGAWKMEAVQNIRIFLENELKRMDAGGRFPVIA